MFFRLTSNGEEPQNDDHVPESVCKFFELCLPTNSACWQSHNEMRKYPKEPKHCDQQINPVSSRLPETPHREGDHFQQNLEFEDCSDAINLSP